MVMIGYPRRVEPLLLGTISGIEIPDLLLGSLVRINNVTFIVNVSYVPENPKRQTLVTILEPIGEIPDSFWIGNAKKEIQKPMKQEEFPF